MEKFDKIVGYTDIKQKLLQLREFLHDIDSYTQYGVRIPRGVLLYGEPGVGKTVMARAIADDGISLVEVRAADCCDDNTVSNIQEAFQQAKRRSPSILLLDELDKIAGTSMHFFMESNDDTRKILLQELDKLDDNDGVLVVGTCNDPRILGDALVRSGRFDRVINVEQPNEEERCLILQKYFGKLKINVTADCKSIARITPGYTGAELECIVNEAGLTAMSDTKEVNMALVQKVINQLAFHGSEKDVINSKHQVAVHEAGHVLVAMMLLPDNLYGASIVSQGSSAGHIKFVDCDGMVSVSDEENSIAVLLAGKVAEREVLGKTYLGAKSDLARAHKKAMSLVMDDGAYGYEYLMYECEIGGTGFNISPSIKQKIADVLNNMDALATDIIRQHRDIFDNIVSMLESKLVLDREDLMTILESSKKKIA